ncbi:hypothetical protein [Gillisia sp. Hel_I_29]|uniref:hypothetical protein n=1 Tax=Gillisia sp. Hel_I_29 TaxID=1249975 RepID=UPI00068F9108|nr:hypothetical protein [Gillisia sp. Hel_I_29]
MKTFMLTLIVILSILVNNLFAQDLEGIWQGNLEVQPGKTMLFVFKISESNESFFTKLDIPSQGLKDLQPAFTTFLDNNLIINASNLGFKFDGVLNKESGEIIGPFKKA